MGREFEIKLEVSDLHLLDCILCDRRIAEKMAAPYRYVKMQTTYFDTDDGFLAARRWMIRVRKEGERSVVTMKTAAEGHSRGEWEVEGEYLHESIEKLVPLGAPEALKEISAEALLPVCGAKFTRILADLTFSDGSTCELAGDIGDLIGAGKYEPICELELELKRGAPDAMMALANELSDFYGIKEQPKSKFARARALAGR